MSQQNLTPFILMICITILYSLLPIANSLTLEIIRRDSFDLNLFPKNLSYAQKNRVFAQLSHSRARRWQARLVSKSSVNGSIFDTIQPPMKQFMDSAFAVSVDIGSRPYHTYLLLDTGSDQTWVQCEGCKDCFSIKNGPFNQSASTSYHIIRFDDRLCKPQIKVGLNCKFERGYESGDAEGVRALENFHFRSSNHMQRITTNILLGCADKVKKWTFGENVDGPNNVISGIFGLSLGYIENENSFLELTEKSTKMKFSYCLPSWTASKYKSIPLSFGDDVPRLPAPAMSTPMDNKMYFLNLSDISVGGKRLHLIPGFFKRRGDDGGFSIDSGSGDTFLVRSAYEKVRRAVAAILASQDKHPVDPIHGHRNRFCYEWPLKIKNPQSLNVTYHLENNADIEVLFEDLFIKEKFKGIKKKFACLTFTYVKDGAPNILGAAHQANYRFVYDLKHKTLHFKREQC